MITFLQIGTFELLCLLAIGLTLGGISMFKPACRRWLLVVAGILGLAMLLTPPDPVSMLVVAAPACALFASGVYLAPYFTRPA